DPPCLEYEYVGGGDLTGLIEEMRAKGGPSLTEAAKIVLNLAGTVGFAHQHQPPIVHRDLKPANLLVGRSLKGKIALRIADFGIGGLAATKAIEEATRLGPGQASRATMGLRGAYTPLYASPQQVRGEPPDPRDDVHALGVIWYQLVTNQWGI